MCFVVFIVLFFFFKQKTAYERRISDWSSDVCSSDLHQLSATATEARECSESDAGIGVAGARLMGQRGSRMQQNAAARSSLSLLTWNIWFDLLAREHRWEIGRASCRERVCQYV